MHATVEDIRRDADRRGAKATTVDIRTLDATVLSELVAISRRGFGTDISAADTLGHILGADTLQLLTIQDQLVGFSAYSNLLLMMDHGFGNAYPYRMLYLSGIVMDKNAQGHGLGPLAITSAIQETGSRSFSLRTQNPAMYEAARKAVLAFNPENTIFPSGEASQEHAGVARILAAKVAEFLGEKSFDPSKSLDERTYGKALNDSVPKVGEDTERLFKNLGVDREEGDSIIMVALLRDRMVDQ